MKLLKFILSILFLSLCNIVLLTVNTAQTFQGDVSLTTQTEVDSFGAKGYTEIIGRLRVNGINISADHIIDLTPPNSIDSVRDLDIYSNSLLANLDGLSLKSVRTLSISYNDLLTNLDGLNSLNNSVANLTIHWNDLLTNIDGLSGITSVNRNLSIVGNDLLTSLVGLSGMISVEGEFFISSNDLLTNLDGLSSLNSVRSSIYINSNSSLTNLDGLFKLHTVTGNLKVQNNSSLNSFCGLYTLLFSSTPNGLKGTYTVADNSTNPTKAEIISGGPCKPSDVEANKIPTEYKLSQNYPNPFNPTTTIKYSIPVVEAKSAFTTKIVAYNILGKKMQTLVNKKQSAGNYEVTFNASNLTSGIYFYRITSGNYTETKQMLLVK